jgi:hypothetical protein
MSAKVHAALELKYKLLERYADQIDGTPSGAAANRIGKPRNLESLELV